MLIGDIDIHPNIPGGQEGHGINIVNCIDVTVKGTIIKNMWGDGIYLGHEYFGSSRVVSDNILIEDVVINRAGRNGISVCGGDNIKIIRPVITGVTRIAPKAGIDVEPESKGALHPYLNNLIIDSPIIKGCGLGLMYNLNFSREGKHLAHNLSNFIIDDCGIGVHIVSGGTNKGQVLMSDFNIINSKNNGMFIANYQAENTPHLLITNLSINDFNSNNGDSGIWTSGLVFYSNDALSDIGNITIDGLSIDRKSDDNNSICLYMYMEANKLYKKVKISNILRLKEVGNAFLFQSFTVKWA